MPQTPYTVEVKLAVPVLGPVSADLCRGLRAPRSTGETEARVVEAVVLENEFLVATFVPELGGRLLSLLDKTTAHDCLSGAMNPSNENGLAGFGGLEVSLDGYPRANTIGSVRCAVTDSGLRLSEVGARGGIGFELLASLGSGVELCLELRFRNRSVGGILWNPGLLWPDEGLEVSRSSEATIAYSSNSQSGFALVIDQDVFRHVSSTSATFYDEPRVLPPRWGESFRFSIVPVSGLGQPKRVSSVAALGFSDNELVIQPRREVSGGKFVLQTAIGKALEAPAELAPATTLRYSFAELGGPPRAFVILDGEGVELFRYPVEPARLGALPDQNPYPDPPPTELTAWERLPAFRYWVANLRTREAFRAGDYAEAFAHAETALLFNGDDHLAWIEKAIAARRLGEVEPDAPELPNAHYLAPMEPLLRAEGFLAQAGLDARTFLAALAGQPNELVEVATAYIDLGLYDDAARFIDAARSVADLPMLRYLYAYVCIVTGKMKADAAAAVASVSRLEPPYPWRPTERLALETLSRTFQGLPVLEAFLALAGA